MIKSLRLSRRSFGVLTFALVVSVYQRPASAGTSRSLSLIVPPEGPKLAKAETRHLLRQNSFFAQGEPLSILQGLTDETSSQFSIVVGTDEQLVYAVADEIGNLLPLQSSRRNLQGSDWAVDIVSVLGLRLQQKYSLKVTDKNGTYRDLREFRALDLANSKAKIGIGSCINDQYEGTDTFIQISKDRPDIFFLIGDSAYADHLGFQRTPADPRQLWDRHAHTRNNTAYYFFKKLIPTLATWDDHDYGLNNGDKNYRYKAESLQNFKTFFPQDASLSPALTAGPGVSVLFKAFGQNFFLLDNRSWRTPRSDATPEHWGLEQEDWLAREAMASDRPTWIMSGSQFFGGYLKGESVEGAFPACLARLGSLLQKLPQVALLVSGDVHFSEYMRIEKAFAGYETFEITASSLSSLFVRYMDRVYTNPRRISSIAMHNYQLIDAEVQGRALKLDMLTRGAGDANLMSFQEVLRR